MTFARQPQGSFAVAPARGRTSFLRIVLFLIVTLVSASAEQLPGRTQLEGVTRVSFRPHRMLAIMPAHLPSATISTSYNTALTATGGTAPYRFVLTAGSTLPSGLSLSPSGHISGTPKTSGSYSFTVAALDSTNSSYGNSTLTLSVNSASQSSKSEAHTNLNITPATLPAGTVAVSYSAALTASGGTAPYQFAVTGGTVPPGLQLYSSGALTGKPTASGSFSFTVSASDTTKNQRGNANISISISAAPVAQVAVSVAPSSLTISSGSAQQFSASVSNTSNTAVTWTASAGSISSSGLFTAPTVSTTSSVTVRATSAADSSRYAQATVTVNPPPAVAVAVSPSSTSITAASTKQFAATVSNASNTAVTWKASAGSISSSGLFTAPNVTTSTSATITATSVADPTQSAQASVTVNPQIVTTSGDGGDNTYCGPGDVSNFGTNDGPAALPQACINTAIANTPSPGNVTLVPAGANLQTALNNAACGDTLELQAGATYTGLFLLPAKSCDSAHWITIRTSAPDSSLPAEGTRITPCYAGVASLPGRPSFNCAALTQALATVMMTSNQGAGPIQLASGANHYRLIGLEITRPAGTGVVYTLVAVQGSGSTIGAADHIVLDRVWLHGTANDDTQRGVGTWGMTSFAVIDSFFTDFHCTAVTGACSDAQAVGGGLGSQPMGAYKIVNNFLEASSENILFGGGAATLTPADIEVRRNHFFKPLIWQKGQPGFVGGSSGNAFVVKNHLELKNAQRVLIEGNIFEYSWGGFSQVGYSVVLTPKNQSGLCPLCQVTDVTIRYNTISHVSGAFQIANVLSDSGVAALAGHNYSIHDVIVDDVQANAYGGPGVFAMLMMTSPALHDVTINHVTAFPSNSLLYVGDTSGTPMANFVFTNNLMTTGPYPMWSTGGGTANCAYYDVPLTTLNACFAPYSFTANALITDSAAAQWPVGNFFSTSTSTVQFANFAGADYTLLSSSPYASAGTDGKPLGADTAAVANATAGVN